MAKDPAHPDELPVIPEKLRKGLAEQNGPLVDEGLNALNKGHRAQTERRRFDGLSQPDVPPEGGD